MKLKIFLITVMFLGVAACSSSQKTEPQPVAPDYYSASSTEEVQQEAPAVAPQPEQVVVVKDTHAVPAAVRISRGDKKAKPRVYARKTEMPVEPKAKPAPEPVQPVVEEETVVVAEVAPAMDTTSQSDSLNASAAEAPAQEEGGLSGMVIFWIILIIAILIALFFWMKNRKKQE